MEAETVIVLILVKNKIVDIAKKITSTTLDTQFGNTQTF